MTDAISNKINDENEETLKDFFEVAAIDTKIYTDYSFISEMCPNPSLADSSKIVHLKDVFQNQHEIVLVLE